MRACIKAQTVCRWRQGEVEIRFEIYDPGTEDKIRLDERGGDLPLIPSGAAQNASAL